MPTAPDTVTEAVQLLERLGYRDQLRLDGSGVHCDACHCDHTPGDVEVTHMFRFEGASDPADEAIVVGLVCPACGMTGLVVSAYGPDADPELFETLTTLTRRDLD